jgi:hypothetical protein
MPNNIPGGDPKTIWQNQPAEPSAMTLEKMRRKMRELHAKTRRQLLGTLAGPLVAAFFYAFAIRAFPSLQQAFNQSFAFALVWSLVGFYILNRGMWSAVLPADAGLSTGLEFCRREIQRRHHLLRRSLLWGFGPILLAIGTFILALATIAGKDHGIFPNGLPFLALVVVWIIGYFIIRLREQRELSREIDELNNIQRENNRQPGDEGNNSATHE